jgi:Ni,Fe-hydrogenase III small subunit/formate hydrogenlyase subunit 6/NADH:ubiquinone oxidoreductase subunit I
MLNILVERFRQKKRTIPFPSEKPALPDRLRGLPRLDAEKCPQGCNACAEACPVDAIAVEKGFALDLGRCLFCTDCTAACPSGALQFTPEYRLSASRREDLVWNGGDLQLARAAGRDIRRLLGRSLKLRKVSAAGCNACEADINVLGTVGFDLGRFGVQFVASPRHADGVLITGPVSRNMTLGLKKTYEAIPAPKIVIACGACAISGGPFQGHPEVNNGAESMLPVDLFIPGCPPHPLTILDGILRFLGRI